MRLPMAARGSRQSSRAIFSEIMATGRALKVSFQVMSRPATIRLPVAAGHLVVDIANTLETKLRAVRCYATQFSKAKEFIFERIRAAAMHDGTAAGYEAGELFASTRTLGTRDLVHFLFGQTPAAEPRKPEVR